MQRLQPLRRELSQEMLLESNKSQKSYRCLACLDSGIVQDWLIRSHGIVSNYRSTDAPMKCCCDAEPSIAVKYLDCRLDNETCLELHRIEVARWKESSAPAPQEVLNAVAQMSSQKQMPQATEHWVEVEAVGAAVVEVTAPTVSPRFVKNEQFLDDEDF
jgi:hypothetical protein